MNFGKDIKEVFEEEGAAIQLIAVRHLGVDGLAHGTGILASVLSRLINFEASAGFTMLGALLEY